MPLEAISLQIRKAIGPFQSDRVTKHIFPMDGSKTSVVQ